MKELNKIKKPWELIDTSFTREKYKETEHLEKTQWIDLVFSWWTMSIWIDSDGLCTVKRLWYKE